MKKTELKKILKPLIKECVKEVILDEGILSGIISEVARGMGGVQITEARPPTPQEQPEEEEEFQTIRRKSLQEQKTKFNAHKKQLLDAIGRDAYNGIDLFEGTDPIKSAGDPSGQPSVSGPMSGVDPGDQGVDITGLFGSVGNHWQAHLSAEK